MKSIFYFEIICSETLKWCSILLEAVPGIEVLSEKFFSLISFIAAALIKLHFSF